MSEDKKKTGDDLTLKQIAFCELYATEKEFFGNGTQAYIEAYDIDVSKPGSYAGARASASALLTNPNILAYIRSLLETAKLNDEFVDRELSFIIEQNADMGTKMRAISEYNKLKSRITNKLELNAIVDGNGITFGDAKNKS